MVKLLKLVVMLLVAWMLWKYVVSNWLDIEYSLPWFGQGHVEHYYGDNRLDYAPHRKHPMEGCEPGFTATKECHDVAQAMCNTTDDRMNVCWLPAFLKCSASATNDLARANCHNYANAYCGGAPSECESCFGKAHQQCMFAKGLGADPSCTNY